MKFEDRGSDIVIVTDNYEESVSKKLFHAENSSGDLKIYGQKVTPSNFIFSSVTYPVETTITSLVTTLNTWAAGNDFHESGGGGGGEPVITPSGNITDFWSGTKTWRNLATDVREVLLTGISFATGTAITATDTILVAFGKLQKQITDLISTVSGKVDSNGAITGATKTKVTYDSKGLVTAGVDATTADITDSTNKRYVTDANLTVIGNTSNTNTGDKPSIQGGFFGVGGSVIVAGYGAIVPYNLSTFTAGNWDIEGNNASGSAVVDILRWNGAAYVSIIGAGNKPTITSARSATAAISGWTSTAIVAGDKFIWQLVSGSVFSTLNVTIRP